MEYTYGTKSLDESLYSFAYILRYVVKVEDNLRKHLPIVSLPLAYILEIGLREFGHLLGCLCWTLSITNRLQLPLQGSWRLTACPLNKSISTSFLILGLQ